MGFVVGIVFVGIGLFVVVPAAGAFGVVWTLMAVAITGYHAVNLFSERGVAHEVVEFDIPSGPAGEPPQNMSPQQRLGRLEDLLRQGLVTDQEYHEQRQRILDEL